MRRRLDRQCRHSGHPLHQTLGEIGVQMLHHQDGSLESCQSGKKNRQGIGPPVDAPIATTGWRRDPPAGLAALALPPRGCRMTRTDVTWRTDCRSSAASVDVHSSALGSASSAPATSALTTETELRSSTADITRIGVGARAMICSITCWLSPSRRCRSRTTMSGWDPVTHSTACAASVDEAITEMSPSLCKASTRSRRCDTPTTSSTTSARICLVRAEAVTRSCPAAG